MDRIPIATWNPEADRWETGEVDIFGHSVAYSETLPKSGMTRNGQLFERPTSVPPTTGHGYSSSRHLPTPKAADGIMGRPRTTGRPIEKSTHLGTIVTLLPPPDASMGERGAQKDLSKFRPSGHRRQIKLNDLPTMLPTPNTMDSLPARECDWGPYTPAIRRWERILGRPAPNPTEPNTKGKPQLAAPFAEYMMGLPEGWVTSEEIGLTRAQQLKAIGNGVCVPQGIAALRMLLDQLEGF